MILTTFVKFENDEEQTESRNIQRFFSVKNTYFLENTKVSKFHLLHPSFYFLQSPFDVMVKLAVAISWEWNPISWPQNKYNVHINNDIVVSVCYLQP